MNESLTLVCSKGYFRFYVDAADTRGKLRSGPLSLIELRPKKLRPELLLLTLGHRLSTAHTMSGASDKARFYLEKYVPELQEYQRKEIFTRDQISAIAATRSDFEHVLNARGSQPADYARYATYEMNLDSLRKKRCKRLGVKNSTTFNGQRTVFFVLERGVKKFPGDMGLWMQYIKYCEQEEANKKLAKAFTSVLRLKPREWGLWVLAAKHYAERQGDMTTARTYMQRGLRFCKDRQELYVEYTRLEMVYLAKLAARRRILGMDVSERQDAEQAQEVDKSMLMLPKITAEDVDQDAKKGLEEVDVKALERLALAPAYTGAIPIAVFDATMTQFSNRADVAECFFDLVASFQTVPARKMVLQHIVDHLQATVPKSSAAIICEVRLSLQDTGLFSAEFPSALGRALSSMKSGLARIPESQQSEIAEKAALLLLPYLKADTDLDPDINRVVVASLNQYLRRVSLTSNKDKFQGGVDVVHAMVMAAQAHGNLTGPQLLQICAKHKPGLGGLAREEMHFAF